MEWRSRITMGSGSNRRITFTTIPRSSEYPGDVSLDHLISQPTGNRRCSYPSFSACAPVGQKRPDQSLTLELSDAARGEEIRRTMSRVPKPVNLGIRTVRASFHFFDHAVH